MVICSSYPWKQTQSSDISRIPARARSFEKPAWWGREDQRDAENSFFFFLLSGTQSLAALLGTLVMPPSHSQVYPLFRTAVKDRWHPWWHLCVTLSMQEVIAGNTVGRGDVSESWESGHHWGQPQWELRPEFSTTERTTVVFRVVWSCLEVLRQDEEIGE